MLELPQLRTEFTKDAHFEVMIAPLKEAALSHDEGGINLPSRGGGSDEGIPFLKILQDSEAEIEKGENAEIDRFVREIPPTKEIIKAIERHLQNNTPVILIGLSGDITVKGVLAVPPVHPGKNEPSQLDPAETSPENLPGEDKVDSLVVPVGLRENGIIDSIIFNPARTPETSGVQQNLLNVATLNSSQPEKAVFREGVAIAQAGEQTARRQYVLETGYEKTNNLELAGKSPLLINQNRNDSQADLLEQNPGKATGIAELTNIPRKIASNISEMTMKPPEGAAKPSDIIVPAALAHAGLEETEVLVKKALNVLGSEKNSLTNETAKPSDSSNRPAGMLPGIPENASKPEEPTRNTPAALTKPIAMFVPATAAHSHLEEYEASGKGTSTILQNATMMKNAADPNAAQIHAHPVVQKPETGAIINDAPLKYQVIAPQLMDGVARIYNTHPNRVKITLNPPELGQLDISVLVKSNKVTLSIVVDSDEVRQVLIANNNFLKNSLQTQGMTVDNMNISLKDGSFRQDLGQGQGGFPERQTGEDPSLPKNRGADATHTPVDPDGSEEGEYRPARISIFI